jgi:hypothetical protein
MDKRCTGDTCTELKSQTAEEAMKCTKEPVVKDDIDGCKSYSPNVLGWFDKAQSTNYFRGITTLPGMVMQA